jgi:hypothetical protein
MPLPAEISVLSFNLWNHYVDCESRCKLFIILIKLLMPTIICLQEFTLTASVIIHPVLLSLGYVASEKMTNSKLKHFDTAIYVLAGNPGVATSTTVKIISDDIYVFDNTKMQRCIKMIKLLINNMYTLTVATSHFESVFSKIAEIKHVQYGQAYDLLTRIISNGVIFAADFNIGNEEDEKVFQNIFLKKKDNTNDNNTNRAHMQDTWIAAGSDTHHEITYNRYSNPYNSESKYHSRLDRILFMDTSKKLQCTSHLVIAGFQKPDGTKYAISDHYGILSKFQVLS